MCAGRKEIPAVLTAGPLQTEDVCTMTEESLETEHVQFSSVTERRMSDRVKL